VSAATAGFDDLAGMIGFLDGNGAQIAALVKEIEEIQREFDTQLVKTTQRFEDAKAAVVAIVEDGGWSGPDWLVQEINERLPTLREAKKKRLEEVNAELDTLTTQRDEIEQESTSATDSLKEANPRLNEREEELKAAQTQTQADIQKNEKELRAAGSGLGWLFGVGRIHRLREEHERLAVKLYGINSRLTEVRKSWKDMAKEENETQDRLQKAWRLRTAEIARVAREQSELEDDLEGACRRGALDEILNAIAAPQETGNPALNEALKKVVSEHDLTKDFEGGIAAVSETMGMLNGIKDGLGRLSESVNGVKKEQDRQAELSNLRLVAPRNAVEFHSLWPELKPVVQDEIEAGLHPRDFARKLKQTIGDRLADKAIEEMFTSLGNELSRATKEQWG